MMKNLLQSPLLALHAMRRDTSSLHGPSFTCAQQSAHDAAAKEGGVEAWSKRCWCEGIEAAILRASSLLKLSAAAEAAGGSGVVLDALRENHPQGIGD